MRRRPTPTTHLCSRRRRGQRRPSHRRKGSGLDTTCVTLLKREGPMSPQRADAAHAARLVHRDVKPSNALMTKGDFTYLIGFGIAHDIAATTVTKTGAIIGTLAYIAQSVSPLGSAEAKRSVGCFAIPRAMTLSRAAGMAELRFDGFGGLRVRCAVICCSALSPG
jgi:serine/threonine protein kinase